MIITHLTYNLCTLKACSLTCRSWYTAAVPCLHHTLTLRKDTHSAARSKLKPLPRLHKLGLMPLVKEIRVDQSWGRCVWFVPREFTRCNLRYFSALANVRTLEVENMEIYRFMPGIERYFKHLSPTLRSITLHNPHCTPRQLSHFLSFFSNLDNIRISEPIAHTPNTTTPDTELTPLSAPKLRGLLQLYRFSWAETWTQLTASCGGLRFRRMDLCKVQNCAPLLLEACTGTLEALRVSEREGVLGG